MPGIVGLVTRIGRERSEPELLRMVEAIRHESFYATGTWIDEASGVYVGWAARKNSFSDGMPLRNERRDVALVFSGEEFPEEPSYLVDRYEADPSFPAGLNGRFHGFLTDCARGTATLFNDRYGMHRIYYHESKDSFYFAAEAKAILSVRPELRRLDPRGMGEFVACGCVLEDRTLFAGVHVLPCAAAWVFRDGRIDVSRSADLYVNERAREIAPVRMTGNYGGEVLRRVRAFKPVDPLPGLFCSEIRPHLRQAHETYTGLLGGHPLSFALFKQAPWHHYGLQALEQTQLALRSPYLDNDFVRTVFRAPPSALANNDVCLRLIADGNPDQLRIWTDRGPIDRSAGRLSTVAARGLLEFLFKAEYAYDYGMPQWLARIDHLLAPLRPERLFLGRHKFYHFRFWYRNALSRYVREMLLDPRTLSRPYLVRNRLEAVVQGHLGGDRNYTTEIHKVLTLELVHRLFLDSK